MIKKLFIFFLFTILHNAAKSQDTIVKKDGSAIAVKIIGITPEEIKYKRFDLPDSGPLYVESKSNVYKIIYANGVINTINDPAAISSTPVPANIGSGTIEYSGRRYKYSGREYDERGIQRVLRSTQDKTIIGLVKQARVAGGLQYISFLALPLVSFGLLYGAVGFFEEDPELLIEGGVYVVGAIACPIIGTSYSQKRKRCNIEAINLFNQKYSKR